MNPLDLQTFNQAIALAQAGQKQDAYGQIKKLYYNYPQNTDVLIWLAYTTSDLNEAEWALNQASVFAPGNQRVSQAWDWLKQARENQWGPPPSSHSEVISTPAPPPYYNPTPAYMPVPAPAPVYYQQPVQVPYYPGMVGFHCPYCRTNMPPLTRQRISTGGWITFAILLMVCFPLCWIGLLMKENYNQCVQCGVNLN